MLKLSYRYLEHEDFYSSPLNLKYRGQRRKQWRTEGVFMAFANRGQGATQQMPAPASGSARPLLHFAPQKDILRAQGATEYLVLLAVVLIIGLVAITLLGYYPGMATDVKITQSHAYWRGDARPFAITEHAINSSGFGSFIIQNIEADGPLVLTALQVGAYNNFSNFSFSSGESRKITIDNMGNNPPGSIYDLNVTITYRSQRGIENKEYGTRNVVGKYS
jgi:hypothetical protein